VLSISDELSGELCRLARELSGEIVSFASPWPIPELPAACGLFGCIDEPISLFLAYFCHHALHESGRFRCQITFRVYGLEIRSGFRVDRRKQPAVIAKRPRGRPRNTRTAAADDAIGRTVWQLLRWGYKLRRQVLPAVATGAKEVLQRTDSAGLALSGQRVEQIYEAWAARAPSGWRGFTVAQLRKPSDYWTDWRILHRPSNRHLHELARELLANEGLWTHPVPKYVGDPVFTRQVADEIDRTRPRGRNEQNGVIK